MLQQIEMQSEIRAVIFDFDGVILDSVDVKTKAFEKLFEPFGRGIQDKVVAHHLANGGVSRFDKISFYYREFLKRPISVKELDERCTEFSSLVLDGVLKADWIRGAEEFIIRYYETYKFFIVSATPDSELMLIIRARGIGDYFVGAYGSPPAKRDLVMGIIEEFCFDPKELVYFGDSMQDHEAAKDASVTFIAINPGVEFAKDVISFRDFRPLVGTFKEMISQQYSERIA